MSIQFSKIGGSVSAAVNPSCTPFLIRTIAKNEKRRKISLRGILYIRGKCFCVFRLTGSAKAVTESTVATGKGKPPEAPGKPRKPRKPPASDSRIANGNSYGNARTSATVKAPTSKHGKHFPNRIKQKHETRIETNRKKNTSRLDSA